MRFKRRFPFVSLSPSPMEHSYASRCTICLEEISLDTRVILSCSHTFHLSCIRKQIESKWPGPRIQFGFLDCALCRRRIDIPLLKLEMLDSLILEKQIEDMAALIAIDENLFPFFSTDQLVARAKEALAFYRCSKCAQIFCGGIASCTENMNISASYLLCDSCVFEESAYLSSKDHRCRKHGYKYAMYKCMYCCREATYVCGARISCTKCHGHFPPSGNPCKGPTNCPLGIPHPPNGSVSDSPPIPFVVGCTRCSGMSDVYFKNDGAVPF